MSDGIAQPGKEVLAQEFEMLSRQVEREKAIARIIASVPEDEPHRDQLIKVLRLATDFSVVRSYLQSPDRKPDQNPITIEFRLSKRDFFSDPTKREEFGHQVLDRAREIIMEFAKPRTGKYGK